MLFDCSHKRIQNICKKQTVSYRAQAFKYKRNHAADSVPFVDKHIKGNPGRNNAECHNSAANIFFLPR